MGQMFSKHGDSRNKVRASQAGRQGTSHWLGHSAGTEIEQILILTPTGGLAARE
jgi:hypothetical protein